MKAFDIRGAASMFDIDADALFGAKRREMAFAELPKFPDVPFEVSVLADRKVYAGDICAIIEKSAREYIRSIEVVSIYEGKPIQEGMKSVSIKIIFGAVDRTLSTDDVSSLQKKVVDALDKNGYKLR
jgi:phenylalanyl-tRNA synthetase beta chain